MAFAAPVLDGMIDADAAHHEDVNAEDADDNGHYAYRNDDDDVADDAGIADDDVDDHAVVLCRFRQWCRC